MPLGLGNQFGHLGGLGRVGIPNVYNLKTSNTAKWQAGLAAMVAGSRDALIGFAGDSLTLGKTTGAVQNLDRQNGAPAQLATLYESSAITPTSYDGIFGTGANVATFNDMDSRLVQTSGTGWVQSASGSLQTAGGPPWAASAAGTYVATPNAHWDTCIIRYPLRTAGSSPGVWSYKVDAGSTTNVDSTTAGTDRTSASVTISAGSVGAHTITVAWVSGVATIGSIEFYNSTQKSVRLRNMGWSGSTTTNWNNATYNTAPINEVINLGCDAIVLCLQDNDITTSIPLATSQANLTAIINAWKPTMDVFLMSAPPMSTGTASAATQDAFVAMLKALAFSLDIPFFDGYARMGGGAGYAVYNAVPYQWYTDDKHLNRTGQGDRAAFEFAAIPKVSAPVTFLLGADGAPLFGADGAYLLGAA